MATALHALGLIQCAEVIWAHGSSMTLSYHGSANRGGSLVDFATLSATGPRLIEG